MSTTNRRRRPVEEDADYMNDILERTRRDASRRRHHRTNDEVDRSLPQPIEVNSCEFFCKDNAKTHHTENYDLLDVKNPSPVFRRGEPFYMAIRFNSPFNVDTDRVKLRLTLGPKKANRKRAFVILPVTSAKAFTKEEDEWDICVSRQERTIVTLQIQIPYTACVGLWRMRIISKIKGHKTPQKHNCKENIYILFNPWCKADPVYLEDDVARQEYVLSDVGKIYVGTHHKPVGRPWVFGQFGDAVLPASILVLEKSGLDIASRGNPIKVVRAISAMVNENDEDNGVLVGNWSGNYGGGTAPWSWTGSTAILEEYLSKGGKPVKYGQCWVFSGVCTSVCRAIGIPCRSVTNFVSAHDADDSLTVDILLDADGNQVAKEKEDSIWNFHVWNECWMTRPDLPIGYGGWQVVDATPQERSEGLYRTGPASLVAISRGEISHLYDAPFVFAEVNADVIHFQVDKNSDYGMKKLSTNTDRVGKLIVTKKAGIDDEFGNRDMEDISLMYKSKEGTNEERMSVLNAIRRGRFRHYYDLPEPGKEDVYFKLRDINKVMIGNKFQVIVDVENRSDEERTVISVLSASTVYYRGVTARKVKRARGTYTLKPKQKEELGIEVTFDDYYDKLVDYSMLKIYAISTVKETQQTWTEEDDFQVEKPPLIIEIEGQLKIYRSFNFTISFTNPLKRTLEDCTLTMEGPGLAEPRKIQLDDVGPEMTMTHVEALTPRKAGLRKITAIFSSRQLIEVLGCKQVLVEE